MISGWVAIHAGGINREAFLRGVWLVPVFKSHDACTHWWRAYCRQTGEERPWGVREVK